MRRIMERNIQQEIAQATLRGERDYAATLQSMELVRTAGGVVHVDNLNKNQKQGYANLERRLRGAA